MRQLLDRKALTTAKNTRGQGLLHVAVLQSRTTLIRYVVKVYPGMVHAKDSVSTGLLGPNHLITVFPMRIPCEVRITQYCIIEY